MPAHTDDTTLYDVLKSYQQVYDEALQPVLSGHEHTSLDLLLRGVGPANMSISTDFNLWSHSKRMNDEMDPAMEPHLFIVEHAASHHSLQELFKATTGLHDSKRVRYTWLAVHGDVQAATILYNEYHRCRDIRSPFVEGLHKHALTSSNDDKFQWYPSVEIEILIKGVTSQCLLQKGLSDFSGL